MDRLDCHLSMWKFRLNGWLVNLFRSFASLLYSLFGSKLSFVYSYHVLSFFPDIWLADEQHGFL